MSSQIGKSDPLQVLPDEYTVLVEGVMANFPFHTLCTKGQMQVRIEKLDEDGRRTLFWEVSPNPKYGEPRILSYWLDTLINKKLDELGSSASRLVRLGSVREICRELGRSGRSVDIEQALTQNASTTIKAFFLYRDREGRQRKFDAVFHRYSVIFTGELMPDGTEADCVYVLLNEIYQAFLSNVPMRPLDYNYLRQLKPSAARFYELLSFRMYLALKFGRPKVSILYSEYCEATGQKRLKTGTEMSKQMYKLHRPHLRGYIATVEYQKVNGADGEDPDWYIWYAPGPRAREEYVRFNADERVSKFVATAASRHLLPRGNSPAEELVTHFQMERFRKAKRRIAPIEVQLAKALIGKHGLEKSKAIVSEAIKASINQGNKPRWMTELKPFIA